MRVTARLLIIFFFFASIFFVSANKIFAANTQNLTPTPIENSLNTNSDVSPDLHNTVQVLMIDSMAAMLCQLSGHDYLHPERGCIGVDPTSGKLGFVKDSRGAVGVMATLIGATFTPPASSMQYVAYLKNNFGIVKPSYAAGINASDCKGQGIGFCGLAPVLSLWIIMRNLTYLIFILVFVLIGVAIMLRLHIDPRTVMTIQNQIPKLIVGLVLVTFSYSIAGLLVDTMYVSSYLLGGVIQSAGETTGNNVGANGKANTSSFTDIVTSVSPVDAANKSYKGGIFGMATDGSSTVTELVNSIFFGPSGNNVFVNNIDDHGDIIVGILKTVLSVVIGLLASLIIFIRIIYVLIRLWIILIFTYINILLDIIFAPFWFLMGLLPGSQLGYSGWFRDMLGNLSIYPASIVMLMLSNVFVNAFRNASSTNQQLFVPPLLGNPANISAVSGIIGLGFLFMLPHVLTLMKGAFKAPKIDFGPVFKPAQVGGSAISAFPKRLFETVERSRYANNAAKTGENRIIAFFGNPLYRSYRPVAGNSHDNPLKEESHTPPTAGGKGE